LIRRGAKKLGDETANDMNKLEIGPTILAYDEWHAAGLELPHLPSMRAYRLNRLMTAV
jgi:hypothetical protein